MEYDYDSLMDNIHSYTLGLIAFDLILLINRDRLHDIHHEIGFIHILLYTISYIVTNILMSILIALIKQPLVD